MAIASWFRYGDHQINFRRLPGVTVIDAADAQTAPGQLILNVQGNQQPSGLATRPWVLPTVRKRRVRPFPVASAV